MGVPFDNITYTIEKTFSEKKPELEKLRNDIDNKIKAPLKYNNNKKLTIKESERLLSGIMEMVLKWMEKLSPKYSLEVWYIIVRRFPNSGFPNKVWIYYFSLAVLKWSSKKQSLSLGLVKSTKGNSKGIGLLITEELLFDCYTFGYLSSILGGFVNIQRWLGKGLKIIIDSNLDIKLLPDKEIMDSVHFYDNRRPENFHFGETGSIMKSSSNDRAELLFLTPIEKRVPIKLPRPNITLFFNRLFYFNSIKNLKDYLNPYREAIEDIYNIEIEAIIHTFYAISQKIIQTIPLNKFEIKNEHISLNTNLDDTVELKRTHFLFSLCHKGYVRFERNKFINELSEISQHPECSTLKSNKELIECFFNSFEINYNNKETIDVLLINNPVILFSNFDNFCYWDFQNSYDFLRGLIIKSMSYLSSQHGDRYTLIIKKILEKEIKDLNVILFNKLLNVNKEKFEIDLLVELNSKVYLIEAKAYSKKRDFWLGKREAVLSRNRRVKGAVNQVKRAIKLLKEYLNYNQLESIPKSCNIEWIVCFPEQEFLHPLNKYGMINNIPRVCTLEELIILIRNNDS